MIVFHTVPSLAGKLASQLGCFAKLPESWELIDLEEAKTLGN